MIDTLICAAFTAIAPIETKALATPKVIPTAVHVLYIDSIPDVATSIITASDDLSQANITLRLDTVIYTPIESQIWASNYLDSVGLPPFSFYGLHYIPMGLRIEGKMNIYSLPYLSSNVLGFSFVPPRMDGEQRADEDGIWMRSDHLNTSTLTHEIGHWCGLYHVFQDVTFCGENAEQHDTLAYLTGDLVADTPPIKPSWSCSDPECLYSFNPARPWHDFQPNNFMDYMDDTCRVAFTDGQIARMHSYLAAYRPSEIEAPISGDINGDGIVGTIDLLFLISCLGITAEGCESADFDANGFVGTFDLMVILANYGLID